LNTNVETGSRSPQELVIFIVGQEKEKFTVHKDFATLRSPVFAAAFDGKFVEGETQTMTLKHAEAPVFGLLVHWLYYQNVKPDKESGSLMRWSKLWMLGREYLIYKLQNDSMATIYNYLVNFSPITGRVDKKSFKDFIKYLYKNDLEGTPLRQITVDQVASQIPSSQWASWRDDIPQAMWFDITIALKTRIENGYAHDQRSLNRYLVAEQVEKHQ